MIKHLPYDVRACIRTGVALTSFAQAVEELALNSIDAGASSIAVRVDFSCFKIQVVDNGMGITLDQFQLIGDRYSTSKCHTVQDLENLKYFGYRGEALASLRSAASFLEITSRSKSSVITYSKCFQNGKMLDVKQASLPRPSAGTTVTAHDLFYNLPVRRHRVNGVLEMEKIRYRLAGIALVWPQISFSLRDDLTGHVILQTHKCSGIIASFSSIFTPARARGLMEVSAEKDEFKLSGIVSKESYSRMDLQFVFVNKRLVLKSSIHRQINKIFGRSLVLRRKGLTNDILEKNLPAGGGSTGSPQKQTERYAIFAINVECPYSAYDITFDPSKTLVEFQDWPKVIHLLQDMLYGFLRKENLLSTTEPTASTSPYGLTYEDDNDGNVEDEEDNCNTITHSESNVPNIIENKNGEKHASVPSVHKFGRSMTAVIENGLFSKTVHRPETVIPTNLLEPSEQIKPRVDQSQVSLAKTSIKQVQSNSHAQETIALNMSEESIANNNLTDALTVIDKNKTDKTGCFGQGTSRNTTNNKFLQISSACQLSPDFVSPECISFHNRKSFTEDLEEVIVKKHMPLMRQEITLGKLAHYSSTLQNLRDMRQTFSAGNKPEIITNTLQLLKKSTQKTLNNLDHLYKTPEKPAALNEDKVSLTKLTQLECGRLSQTKGTQLEGSMENTINNNPYTKQVESTLNHGCLKTLALNECLITCNSNHGNSNIQGSINLNNTTTTHAETIVMGSHLNENVNTYKSTHGNNDLCEPMEHDLNNRFTNLLETTVRSNDLNEQFHTYKRKLKHGCIVGTKKHNLSDPSTKKDDFSLLCGQVKEPAFNECANAYKSKCSNDCLQRTQEENCNKPSTSHVNNVVGSGEIISFYGDSNLFTKFRCANEDRPLGLNDRVIGVKRTCDHKTSHASKLVKLMRGEKVATGSQEISLNNDIGMGSLAAFSYSKQQRQTNFKHSDLSDRSCGIPDMPFLSGAQKVDDPCNGDLFQCTTNIFPDHHAGDGNKVIMNSDRNGQKENMLSSEMPIFLEHPTGERNEAIINSDRNCRKRSLLLSEIPQTSSLLAPCNECCCCETVCHAKRQPDHDKNCLPFSIYKKVEDFVEEEEEVDKSPKVSIILSLPLESGKSQIDHLQNLNRQATSNCLSEVNSLFHQNRKNKTSENGAEQNVNLSHLRTHIFTEETAGLPHLMIQSIQSRNSHHKEAQKVRHNPTSPSLSDKDLESSQGFCFIQEHLTTPYQTGAKKINCESNTSTPTLSQGFSINAANCDNDYSESASESDTLSCLLKSKNNIDNFEESPEGYDSAGFSPTNNASSTQGEDSSSCVQSRNSILCLENNTACIYEPNTNPIGLSNSDADIQNNRNTEQKDKTSNVLNGLPISSIEDDSDIPEDKESHYSCYSRTPLLSIQVTENHSFVKKANSAMMAEEEEVGKSTRETESAGHHILTSTSHQDSLPINKPVILAYDSLKDFDTVPETEDMDNSELGNTETNVTDVAMRSAASVFNKVDSKGEPNNAHIEDNNTNEVINMVANAKQIFKNMHKSFGIFDSTEDPCNPFNNEKRTTGISLHNENTFAENTNRDINPQKIIKTNAYSEIDGFVRTPRTYLQHHTNDCGQYLFDKPEGNRMESSRLNIMSSLSSDIIPCGQRTADEDNAVNTSLVALYTPLRTRPNSQLTGQTVTDSTEISSYNPMGLDLECSTLTSVEPFPPSSSNSPKDFTEATKEQDLTCGNEKDIPQRHFISSEVKQALSSLQNKQESMKVTTNAKICNNSKHLSTLEPAFSLEMENDGVSGNKSIFSQTAQFNMMSSGCDQVLMMMDEPVLSPPLENENLKRKNNINYNSNNSLGASKMSAIDIGGEQFEIGHMSVTLEENMTTVNKAEDDHREAESVEIQTCNSHIGLSSYIGVLATRSSTLAHIKSDIVSSSLSLLRQAKEVQELWRTPHQDKHSNEKDSSSAKADRAYEVEEPVSSNKTLGSLTQESHCVEKPGEDVDSQMMETEPTKNVVVDSSVSNQDPAKDIGVDSSLSKQELAKDMGVDSSLSNQEPAKDMGVDSTHSNADTVTSQKETTKMACWKEVTHPETGQRVYINNLSGHTVGDKQWTLMSSQTQKEMLTIPSECMTAPTVEGPAALSASEKQELTNLVTDHFEQEESEAVSKWRKGERPVYDKNFEADVSTLMARWTNPVYLPYKQPGLLADMLPSGSAAARSCFKTLSSVEFTKSVLGTVKVIGQLDNKFIACIIEKPPDFSNAINPKNNNLLVLFDQHAVHERIRLEHLTEETYEIENGEKTDRLKRSEVKPPQEITMDQDDLRIVKAFKQEFNRIGVYFTIDKSSRNTLHVNSLPSCMVDKDTTELKKKKMANVIDSVENLIKEHIELLKSTNGACGGRLPLAIHKVLCSQACHGAVKFGDKLTLQDCQDLLSSLASCSLPFQCAHGRPSIAPLVSLKILEKELCSTTRPPNLWKISQNMKE